MTDRQGEDELTLAQVMLPEDANPRGNVHGGTLMKLADTAGGVCATRHTRQRVVTIVEERRARRIQRKLEPVGA